MKTFLFLIATLTCLNLFSQDTVYVTSVADPNINEYEYNPVDSLCAPELLGTLHWAFNKALDSEAETVYIVFNIPGLGPHVIYLSYSLPQLTRTVNIDGTSQPGYQPGIPAVIIDGGDLLKHGISLYSTNYSSIKGLCIRNFQYTGILCNIVTYSVFSENVIYDIYRNQLDLMLGEGAMGFLSSSYNEIKGNTIGTDITGNPYNNRYYGINFQKIPSDRVMTPSSVYNIIGGVSFGEGNTIANNGRGVVIGAGCVGNRISGNRIYNNSKAIFLSSGTISPYLSGGNYNKPAPTIDSFDGVTVMGTSAPNDTIEIFGSMGSEKADEYLTKVLADSNGVWSTSVSTAYLGIVATATDYHNNTSGLSETMFFTYDDETEQILSPEGLLDTVFDRFGNVYTLSDLIVPVQNTKAVPPSHCGCFTVYFLAGSGMDGSSPIETTRRDILCDVLTEISNFVSPGPGANVILYIDDLNSIPGVPVSAVAGASAFYSVPSSATIGGIVDNEVWKTLISGTDSYTNTVNPINTYGGNSISIYHGFMAFRFPTFDNWYYGTDPSAITPTQNDLYTFILHETLHLLGFNSLINNNGNSISPFPYFSRYDLRLLNDVNTPLLHTASLFSIYNNSFNATLNNLLAGGGLPCVYGITNCTLAVKYSGATTQTVYTPNCWEPGVSLSHFEDYCLVPSQNDDYFVMSNSTFSGKCKRWPTPEERLVLCDLGYRVNVDFGNSTYFSNFNYTGFPVCNSFTDPSITYSNQVVGVNDGLNTGIYDYLTTPLNPVHLMPLSNDFNADRFEGMEIVIGAGTWGTSTLTIQDYTPTSPGLHLLRYIPYNHLTNIRGNITYIYVFCIDNINCQPNACEIINGGDFETSVMLSMN